MYAIGIFSGNENGSIQLPSFANRAGRQLPPPPCQYRSIGAPPCHAQACFHRSQRPLIPNMLSNISFIRPKMSCPRSKKKSRRPIMARSDPESADRGMTPPKKKKRANEILAISTKKCSSKGKKEKPHLGERDTPAAEAWIYDPFLLFPTSFLPSLPFSFPAMLNACT